MSSDPEIGKSIRAAGFATNYHDHGTGSPVVLLHGSGPGVSAWANWRLTIPALAERHRVVAPDLLGFGYTERPESNRYDVASWMEHVIAFLDALGLERVGLVGNSFGTAIALRLAAEHPERVTRVVLMGAVGVPFPLTPGLDAAWGYQPSVENMRNLMTIFAYDRALVTDELAELRYRASIRPGAQEAFAAMFPAPRQRWIEALALPDETLRGLRQQFLIVHGREDRVIPLANAYALHERIDRSELHVFGRCGHWTQIEHARRFNRLVADFFAEEG